MMMILEHVPCDLCGSEKYKVRYRKPDDWLQSTLYQFPVVECTTCGLVYLNPRPTVESMRDFYPRGYHENRDTDAITVRYQHQKSILPSLDRKRILDIGCARGDFLSYLLDTGPEFEAFGVDAFSEGVKDSRIRFENKLLPSVGYPSDFFDIIMSWAVFEHLHTPSAYFSEAARILMKGGKLIILVTNADSFYSKYAYAEDVPRHTYHYSKKTLSLYGEKFGLALCRIDYRDDIFDGRGFGTFKHLAGWCCGFKWEDHLLGRVKPHQRLAMRIGSLCDRWVFGCHWEAFCGRSGIMVATYERN